MNKNGSVRISGKRRPFRKSTIKSGLNKCFRYQNTQIGTAGPELRNIKPKKVSN